MPINKPLEQQITVLEFVVGSFIAAYRAWWLLLNVFEPRNAPAADQLFRFQSASERLWPRYDSTIVHVALSDAALQQNIRGIEK